MLNWGMKKTHIFPCANCEVDSSSLTTTLVASFELACFACVCVAKRYHLLSAAATVGERESGDWRGGANGDTLDAAAAYSLGFASWLHEKVAAKAAAGVEPWASGLLRLDTARAGTPSGLSKLPCVAPWHVDPCLTSLFFKPKTQLQRSNSEDEVPSRRVFWWLRAQVRARHAAGDRGGRVPAPRE